MSRVWALAQVGRDAAAVKPPLPASKTLAALKALPMRAA